MAASTTNDATSLRGIGISVMVWAAMAALTAPTTTSRDAGAPVSTIAKHRPPNAMPIASRTSRTRTASDCEARQRATPATTA
jgi:hypothetical protein